MSPDDRLFADIALHLRLLTSDQLGAALEHLGTAPPHVTLETVVAESRWLAPAQLEEIRSHRQRILERRRARAQGVAEAGATVPSPTFTATGAGAAPTERTLFVPSAGRRSPSGEFDVEREPPPRRRTTPTAEQLGYESSPVIAVAPHAPSPRPPAAAPPAAAPAAAAPPQPAPQAPAVTAAPHAEQAAHAARLPTRQAAASAVVEDALVQDKPGQAPMLLRALHFAIQHGASDVHLHSGAPLMARQHGRLLPLQGATALTEAGARKAIAQIVTDEQWHQLAVEGQVDFALGVPRLGRFRVNAYRQHRGMDIVFRIIPPQIPGLEQLGLPERLSRLVDYRTGLVLCTGPAGCGKSTTLSALLNLVIQSRHDHVLTIEDPVEYIFPPGKAMVNQRNVGKHTKSFARALRAALREDPDVIAITELRDRETISLALSAAETGHLVLGTLHTGNAAQTIGRVINAFPAEEQAQIRTMLAESLRAVVSQRLVPRADRPGRALALEVLIVNTAVSNLIREEKEFQLGSVMQTGKELGMVTLDDSLAAMVTEGVIDKEQALRYAENKERFR